MLVIPVSNDNTACKSEVKSRPGHGSASPVNMSPILSHGVSPTKSLPSSAQISGAVMPGWSLQTTNPSFGMNDCGNGSYCPPALYCNPTAGLDIPACCASRSIPQFLLLRSRTYLEPPANNCCPDIERNPGCADTTWVDPMGKVKPTCVASDYVGSLSLYNDCMSPEPAT
jgi:hypothetical protein